MRDHPQTGGAKRSESADSLRGLAAVLVIAGHLITRDLDRLPQPNYFFNMLYCVHMPVFFFFAGLFAKSGLTKDLRTVAGQKAARLLVPYVTWSSVAVAAKAALSLLRGSWNLSETLGQWSRTLLYAESMWFFLSLFTMHLLFWGLTRLWRRSPALAVAAGVVCWLVPADNFLSIHNTQGMMPYFALGLLTASHKHAVLSFAREKRKWLLVAAAVVVCVSPLYIVSACQWRLDYGVRLVLGGGLSVLTAGAVCAVCDGLMDVVPAARRLFTLFGRYSMELYCIHMVFVNYLPISVPQGILAMAEPVVDAVYFIMALGVGLVCVGLSYVILNRIPIYRWFMLGQWPQAISKVRKNHENLEK